MGLAFKARQDAPISVRGAVHLLKRLARTVIFDYLRRQRLVKRPLQLRPASGDPGADRQHGVNFPRRLTARSKTMFRSDGDGNHFRLPGGFGWLRNPELLFPRNPRHRCDARVRVSIVAVVMTSYRTPPVHQRDSDSQRSGEPKESGSSRRSISWLHPVRSRPWKPRCCSANVTRPSSPRARLQASQSNARYSARRT